MDERENTMRRGVKMAIKAAALSVGATALVMAATATEATAETASSVSDDAPGPEPLRMDGWSCISRGPLAPPAIPPDFDLLLARVPA